MVDAVVELLTRLGGVATRPQLLEAVRRRDLREAVSAGRLLRPARGRYVLPTAEAGRREAHRLSAVACRRTAAASYEWPLKTQPTRPELVVPRGRKVAPGDREACEIHWRRLDPSEVDGWRTTAVRTVIDCAVALPFDEALAVADSALRAGDVTRAQLLSAAERLPSRGRDAAAEIAWRADGRAANPFESVVRAVSYSAPGIRLVPQRRLRVGGTTIRPDLVDEQLRIVVECDSAEFHTSGRAIDKDCWRYTELALDGWLLLRVSWVQAMYRQPWVRSAMVRATDRQELTLGTTVAHARRFARGAGRGPGPVAPTTVTARRPR